MNFKCPHCSEPIDVKFEVHGSSGGGRGGVANALAQAAAGGGPSTFFTGPLSQTCDLCGFLFQQHSWYYHRCPNKQGR